jgi:hypothetical protein
MMTADPRTGMIEAFIVAFALLALVLSPTGAVAQDDEVSFPPTAAGEWEGMLDFYGYLSIDAESPDGAFTAKVIDVIGSTRIRLGFTVDETGHVEGTMQVSLEWFDESVGAGPTGIPFHIMSDQRQNGALALSGTAARLVANGTLIHETITSSEGAVIEEVSGSEGRDLEWVFRVTNADCELVTGRLIESSGLSLMDSVLLPRITETASGSSIYNELVADLLLWPKSHATTEAVKAAMDKVTVVADELRLRQVPDASHLLELVDAWSGLMKQVKALNACGTAEVVWDPMFERSWLVMILQGALETVIESVDHYEARELIELWDLGMEQDAFDADVFLGFLDALHAKLDEAIQRGDAATIADILAFATAKGFPTLEAKAKAASGV